MRATCQPIIATAGARSAGIGNRLPVYDTLRRICWCYQWRKSDGKFFLGGNDDTACGQKFESLIHIICHDKTSDTVEDNLY